MASAEKLATVRNRGKRKRGKTFPVASGGELALSGKRGKSHTGEITVGLHVIGRFDVKFL